LGRAKVPLDSVLGLRDRKEKGEVLQSKPSDEDPSRDSHVSDLSIASSTSASTKPINHSVDSDGGAAHETGPSNSEADIPATSDLDQLSPDDSTSWWKYVGWTSTSIATTSLTPFPELKPTSTLVDPLGNVNAVSAGTIIGSGSAESGLVNEAGEANSAEPVEEKVQGGASDQSVPIASWYSPWGWYSSAKVDEPAQLKSESPGVKTISGDIPQDPRPEPASSETPGG
jgi:hypothetical protein